jgi:hypothetical protein
MLKMLQYLIVLALALVLNVSSSNAQASVVPRTLSYQGYLTRSDGTAVASSVNMTFSLYAAATGGSPLWSELHTSVPVVNGICSLVLGDTVPIKLPFDIPYYLATSVGTDPEMSPRQPLNSVPFALRAGCNPGDMMSCYTGDIATLGTGWCRAGVRTCNPDGTGFGPCVGEVLPNTPANIGLSANPASVLIAQTSAPVVVSANVTRGAGGPVPDGTVVNYLVTSGVGTLTGVTTTVGGVATAILNSSVAGTVVVTASAGTVNNGVGVSFTSPTLAIVKVATSGTLAAGQFIGGLSATVTFPAAGLTIADGDVSASGAGLGSLLGSNPGTPGQVRLAIVNPNGIQVGEFATLTFHVAPGTFPKTSDFAIDIAQAVDANGQAIPGIAAGIQSVTFQASGATTGSTGTGSGGMF